MMKTLIFMAIIGMQLVSAPAFSPKALKKHQANFDECGFSMDVNPLYWERRELEFDKETLSFVWPDNDELLYGYFKQGLVGLVYKRAPESSVWLDITASRFELKMDTIDPQAYFRSILAARDEDEDVTIINSEVFQDGSGNWVLDYSLYDAYFEENTMAHVVITKHNIYVIEVESEGDVSREFEAVKNSFKVEER